MKSKNIDFIPILDFKSNDLRDLDEKGAIIIITVQISLISGQNNYQYIVRTYVRGKNLYVSKTARV